MLWTKVAGEIFLLPSSCQIQAILKKLDGLKRNTVFFFQIGVCLRPKLRDKTLKIKKDEEKLDSNRIFRRLRIFLKI